ncbi:MAG: flagellar motor switch protein FliN [Spirochaetes bacterium]|nr:flagellar motor switch protein FliN [Spirochaetota bacterium]
MKLASVQDVKVLVQAVLGETDLTLGEIVALSNGSIIELRRLAGEPVDVVAAGEVIAKGEVVVIDENFGIRLTKMLKTAAGGAS